MLVMLRPKMPGTNLAWPGNFRRVMRDEEGNAVKTLTFTPGVPVNVSDDEYVYLMPDIGPALVDVEMDGQRPRVATAEGDKSPEAMPPAQMVTAEVNPAEAAELKNIEVADKPRKRRQR